MATLMEHSNDHDGFVFRDEIYGIREVLEMAASDGEVQPRKLERIFSHPIQELSKLACESVSKAGSLEVIPESRLFSIALRLGSEDEAALHWFRRRCSLSRISSSISSHGLPSVGLA
jgi:hypothetical protein